MSNREEIIRLVGEGKSYREVASIVGISHSRVGQIVLDERKKGTLPGGGVLVKRRKGHYRTQRRDQLYKFIVEYKTKNDGNSPTLAEMQGAGYSSKSAVHHALRVLERIGLIRLVKEGDRGSQIHLVGGEYIPPEKKEGA